MKLSANGKKLIQKYEGLRLEAYKVVASEKYYTIGYGHYGPDVRSDDKITKAEADKLFDQDVQKFVDGVNKYVTATVNQNQFDALVSFSYNCGLGNLQSSTLLSKLNKKDYLGAANEFTRWNKSGGKVLQGLVNRRNEEKALFLTPVKVTSSTSSTSKTYTVKKGDTLSEIAVSLKTTVTDLLKLNPDIKDPNTIQVGKKIKYSVKASATSKTYTVKKGDTLSEIAVNLKTTVTNLLKKNPEIKNPDNIQVNQKIKY